MFLQTQFLLINGHFVLNLLAALVCFAVSWLYYDAWSGRRDTREGTKALGFLLLSLSFVVDATIVDQALIETSLVGNEIAGFVVVILRIFAYFVLIIGQVIDPLQPLPKYRLKGPAILVGSIPLVELSHFTLPILAVVTAFLYLRRATVGLEHHLKPISASFFVLALAELLGTAFAFRASSDITVANLTRAFGPLWFIENLVIILFFFLLGKWVWGYLIRRLETQLLMIFTTTTLMIFLVTTVFFTTASMNNLRNSTLDNLKINVNVLEFTIDGKRSSALSDAQVIAQNQELVKSVGDKERTSLKELATSFLLAKEQTFLTVVSDTGEILARADDPDKVGGSLSDDPMVIRALDGEEVTGVVTREGVLAPEVSVRAAVPVASASGTVGAVILGTSIDNAFVDGLKAATGLDASVYADNVRSATTFVAPDGKSRWVGIKEESKEVKKTVLVDGEIFTGTVNILNIPYFAAFEPLFDVGGNPVGMLFVGTTQASLLEIASENIELTFLVTAGLLVFSVFPAYIVSKYIIEQIK